MEKKTGNFQNFSLDDAMRLAKTDTAQQLFALLQQNGSEQLQQAMEQASAGNYEQAKQMLSKLLSAPDAAALLQKLKE